MPKKIIVLIVVIAILSLILSYKLGQGLERNKQKQLQSVPHYSGDYTHSVRVGKGEDCDAIAIYTYDKNNILVNCRAKFIFHDEAKANEAYKNWENSEKAGDIKNLKRDGLVIIFNEVGTVNYEGDKLENSLEIDEDNSVLAF